MDPRNLNSRNPDPPLQQDETDGEVNHVPNSDPTNAADGGSNHVPNPDSQLQQDETDGEVIRMLNSDPPIFPIGSAEWINNILNDSERMSRSSNAPVGYIPLDLLAYYLPANAVITFGPYIIYNPAPQDIIPRIGPSYNHYAYGHESRAGNHQMEDLSVPNKRKSPTRSAGLDSAGISRTQSNDRNLENLALRQKSRTLPSTIGQQNLVLSPDANPGSSSWSRNLPPAYWDTQGRLLPSGSGVNQPNFPHYGSYPLQIPRGIPTQPQFMHYSYTTYVFEPLVVNPYLPYMGIPFTDLFGMPIWRNQRVPRSICPAVDAGRMNQLTTHDEHRDMRLDIDNWPHEALVALQDSMGSVSTGLSETEISSCFKKSVHISEENEKCPICQEEFMVNDSVGRLNCGHKLHLHCLNQWLGHKNWCPICRTTARPSSKK